MIDRPTQLIAGVRVHYYGPVDDRVRALIAGGLEALRAGRLRRWRLSIKGSGGCCIDMPAELDAAAVRAAVLADPSYAPSEPKRLTVEEAGDRSGSRGWMRVLGLGGCIAIEDAAIQPDLFEVAA